MKDSEALDLVNKRFKNAKTYVKDNYWDTWKDCWKLVNNKRVAPQYIGNTDTFLPETFTIKQAIRAHVLGGQLKVEFFPTRDDQTGDTRVLNSLWKFTTEQENLGIKLGHTIDDVIDVGNGYICTFMGDKWPTFRYFNPTDIFFDPESTCYENCRYYIYRYYTTVEKLKEKTIANADYDTEQKTTKKNAPRVMRYQNLDKIKPNKEAKEEQDSSKAIFEDILFSNSLKDREDAVECLVYTDLKRMITVANRGVVIENVETPFQRKAKTIKSFADDGTPIPVELPAIKPFLPFAPFRNYIHGALFYAKGDVEVIAELQERLNDTANQKFDNLTFALNRMWTIDPAYEHMKDQIESVPGAVFPIPSGALQPLNGVPIGVDADNEMLAIKDAMRRATGADELVQGAGQDRGLMTAQEVRAQLAQAGKRFGTKLYNLENEGLKILAANWFKLIQIHLDTETAVRILGADGVEWQNFNPGEYLGDYEPRVMLDTTAAAVKEELKQEAMQFYLLASKLPFVDQQKLFVETSTKIFDRDEEDVQNMLAQEPQITVDTAEDVNAPGVPQGPQNAERPVPQPAY